MSASQAALLTKMGIKPFSYGMKVTHVYDNGSVFEAKVLDITDDVVVGKFMGGIQNIAALSREIGIPTEVDGRERSLERGERGMGHVQFASI